MSGDEHDRHILVHQCYWPVFHFGGGVTLGMYVAYLFQFQGAFQCYWIVYASAQIQKIVGVGEESGNVFYLVILFQHPLHFLGYDVQLSNGLLIDSIAQRAELVSQSQ